MAFSVNKRKALEQATKYAQKGQLDKALKEYQAVVQADPHDTQVRLRIGDLYLRKGDPGKAIQAYDQVAAHLASKGFEAKAVAIYRQILKINQDYVDARVRLGDLYQKLGLIPDALRELEQAAEHYRQQGSKQRAFDLLRRVASLNPDNVTNRLGLADLLFREGMTQEAEEEYQSLIRDINVDERAEDLARVADQMLERFPGDLEGLRALAQGKLGCGLAGEAVERMRKALPDHPDDIPIRELLAEACTAAGDDEGAQAVYGEIAELYKQRGDPDKAREILQRYAAPDPIGSAPRELDGLEGLADEDDESDSTPSLLLLEELPEEATSPSSEMEFVESPSGEAEPLPEEEPEDFLAQARVALEFADLEGAEAKARQALEGQPLSDGARAVLAEVCARKGHLDEAVRLTEERKTLAASVAEGELLSEIEGQLRDYLDQRRALGGEVDDQEGPDPLDEWLPDTTGPTHPRKGARARAEARRPPVEPARPARSARPESAEDPDDFSTLPDVELVLEDESRRAEGPLEPPDLDIEVEEGPSTDSGLHAIEVEIVDSEQEAEAPQAVTPSRAATQAAESLEEAEFYLEQGMLDEAEQLLRSILEAVPNHPQALLRLGEIAADRGDSPEALSPELSMDSMETTVAQDSSRPDEEAEDVSLGSLDFEEDPEPEDENAFDLAAELESSISDASAGPTKGETGGADGSSGQSSFHAVFQAFKAGIEEQVGEGEFETRYDLGIGYREMGLLEDAVREFELASQGGERRIEALSSLAACKVEMGQAVEAVAHLKSALRLAKGQPDASLNLHYELGQALAEAGQPSQALKEFERVRKVSPGFREVEDRIRELQA